MQKTNTIHMDDESGNMVISMRSASLNVELDSGGNATQSTRSQEDINALREIPVCIEVGRRIERLNNNTTSTSEHVQIKSFIPVLTALFDEKTENSIL